MRFLLVCEKISDSEAIRLFADRVAMSFYELGDNRPGRLVVPFRGLNLGDSVLRTSSISRSLTLLQSPFFLGRFLSLFIEPRLLAHIGELSPDSIIELHRSSFWRGFLTDYHESAKAISKTLGSLTEEETKETIVDVFANHLSLSISRETATFEILYGTLFFILHLPALSFSSVAQRYLEKSKKAIHLRLAHPHLHQFLKWLEKRLKFCANSTGK